MDALSDPRGYLSAKEKEEAKRLEQLAKLGIESDEIDTKNVILGKGAYVCIFIRILKILCNDLFECPASIKCILYLDYSL